MTAAVVKVSDHLHPAERLADELREHGWSGSDTKRAEEALDMAGREARFYADATKQLRVKLHGERGKRRELEREVAILKRDAGAVRDGVMAQLSAALKEGPAELERVARAIVTSGRVAEVCAEVAK